MKNVVSTAAAVIAGATSIFIGPVGVAAAEPELNGTYTFSFDTTQSRAAKNRGVKTTQWQIAPCGPGCAQVVGDGAEPEEMHLVNGRWEMNSEFQLQGFTCPDAGKSSSNTIVTWFDAQTLTGWRSNTQNCVGMTIEGPASLTPA